jgi:SAM-dependent methyltransferase
MPALDYSKIAQYYDFYSQAQIDVDFFLQEARDCGRVLELTSGTGRLSIPLLQANIPLSCLDSSPEMLGVLRGKLKKYGLSAPVYEMDVIDFSLSDKFNLIIIPFNAFSEIIDPVAQRAALVNIRAHLAAGGRLICTLHNPTVRLANVDGQEHLRSRNVIPDHGGTLLVTSREYFDPKTCRVTGAQILEMRDPNNILLSKLSFDLKFFLHSRDTFEALIEATSYCVFHLYGDYERNDFQPDFSPFMIYALQAEKAARSS